MGTNLRPSAVFCSIPVARRPAGRGSDTNLRFSDTIWARPASIDEPALHGLTDIRLKGVRITLVPAT
ncbi:hypothetical protein SDC9_109816 [bioreactor metagenome]|uniref:Uncharacterized protein n=1 Tax=bioreactor metagenome TaxID=1076179 RepID=A0A645BD12_9ZZZZ